MPKKANLNVSSRAEPSHLFHFFSVSLLLFPSLFVYCPLYYFLFKSKRVAMLSRINSFAFSARDNYRCKNVERYSILFHRRIRQSFIFILCARRFRRNNDRVGDSEARGMTLRQWWDNNERRGGECRERAVRLLPLLHYIWSEKKRK